MIPPYDAVPLTVDASVAELVRALYPDLNETGVRNYTEIIIRLGDPKFQALLAERKAAGKCLTQSRVADGHPWLGDCLVHEVPDTMDHYFKMNPGASTD